MHPIINKATAADTKSFYFRREHIGCSVVVDGDLGTSTIAVNFLGADKATPTAATDSDGVALTLTATNVAIPITSSGYLQFVKGVTVAAVGVNIHGFE